MYPLIIIGMILMIAMLIGIIQLAKFGDAHWVMARNGNYRIYKVHGNMYHTWEYQLQKKGLLGWDTVGEHNRTKDEPRYNEWIEKYKLKK